MTGVMVLSVIAGLVFAVEVWALTAPNNRREAERETEQWQSK